MGIVLAAIIVFSGRDAPLALVGEGFNLASICLGGGVFVLAMWLLYGWVGRLGARTPAAGH
jgi:hypothetical protein